MQAAGMRVAFAFAALAAAGVGATPPVRLLDAVACVRLLNSTSQVGCATSKRGVIAPVHALAPAADQPLSPAALQLLAAEARRWERPRVILLDATLFCTAAVDALVGSLGEQMAGLVLLRPPVGADESQSLPAEHPWGGLSRPPATSHADALVDAAGYAWNPGGDGLLGRAFNFPILLADSADSDALRAAAAVAGRAGNGDGVPLVELRYAMHARGSSAECLPQGTCLPLGGQSVWGLLGGLGLSDDRTGPGGPSDSSPDSPVPAGPGARPLVWLAASLDGTSPFHDMTPAGLEAVSGAVATVAAVVALSSPQVSALLQAELPQPRGAGGAGAAQAGIAQIAFGLFHGESYGNLGSSRLVSDIVAAAAASAGGGGSASGGWCSERRAGGACAQPWRVSAAWERLLLVSPSPLSSPPPSPPPPSPPTAAAAAGAASRASAVGGGGSGALAARPVRAVLAVGSVGARRAGAGANAGAPCAPRLHHALPPRGADAAAAATSAFLSALTGAQLAAAGASAYGASLAPATAYPLVPSSAAGAEKAARGAAARKAAAGAAGGDGGKGVGDGAADSGADIGGDGAGLPPRSAARAFARLVGQSSEEERRPFALPATFPPAAAAAAITPSGTPGGGGDGGGGGGVLLELTEFDGPLVPPSLPAGAGADDGGDGCDGGYAGANPRLGSAADDARAVAPARVCAAADTVARAALLLAGVPAAAIAAALGPMAGGAEADADADAGAGGAAAGVRAAPTRVGGGGGGARSKGGAEGVRAPGPAGGAAAVDCHLVDALLACLLPAAMPQPAARNASDGGGGDDGGGARVPASSCELARQLDVGGVLSSHYVGIYMAGPNQPAAISPTAELLRRLLAALLPQQDGSAPIGLGAPREGAEAAAPPAPAAGRVACTLDEDCAAMVEKGGNADSACVRRGCVFRPTAFLHDAFSPGIDRSSADDFWRVTDPTLPNWAEPFWDPFTAQLWAHGASAAEGWSLCTCALAAAAITYMAVWTARMVFDSAAVRFQAHTMMASRRR